MSRKINNIGFGNHGHVRKSRNRENEGSRVLPKWEWKVTNAKWSRIIQGNFWPMLFHIFTMTWFKNGTKGLDKFPITFRWCFPWFSCDVPLADWKNGKLDYLQAKNANVERPGSPTRAQHAWWSGATLSGCLATPMELSWRSKRMSRRNLTLSLEPILGSYKEYNKY